MAVIITVPSAVFMEATELAVWDIPHSPWVVATVKMDKGVARSWPDKVFFVHK